MGNEQNLRTKIFKSLRDLFRLSMDTDKEGTINGIRESVEFRGNNLWALIIAILVASIGLNVNSVAVIIGAMLISPLMGPITGAGLALGLVDFQLLKKSILNLLLMTSISLLTSWIYFSISPITGLTPELSSRTTPNFFDVLIAILGGTALIISLSRKTRSTNALAGVAIATALMPPLCAAGFGLASHNLGFFFGAFYLYLINSIIIGLTTFIFSVYLKLGENHDKSHKLLTKRNLLLFLLVIVLFIAPSIFMTINLVQETTYRAQVDQFIEKNMKFTNSRILKVDRKDDSGHRVIEVTIIGANLSNEMIDHLKMILPQFGLQNTDLKIIQNSSVMSESEFKKTDLIANIQESNAIEVQSFKSEIEKLKEQLSTYTDKNLLLGKITKEITILFPNVEKISYGDMLVSDGGPLKAEKKYTVLVKWLKDASESDKAKLLIFIKLRLELENIELIDLQ